MRIKAYCQRCVFQLVQTVRSARWCGLKPVPLSNELSTLFALYPVGTDEYGLLRHRQLYESFTGKKRELNNTAHDESVSHMA